jgi:exodeoxyribonuclease VII small subunit
MPKDNNKLNNSLSKLQEIVAWFEEQSEVDVEEGLKKMREGAALVKELKTKLATAENEFEEIKKDLLK